MKLIIAEKPSVAKSIASALGVTSRADGYFEGNGLIVSWCVGHLVSPMDAASYDERYKKWRYDDLPILPEPFQYVLAPGKEDAFCNLRNLMNRADVDTIVNACDAGREGELIFRLVYGMTGCTKPVERLWISSMEDSAIREGFKELRPGSEYDALYHSALCRQKADWLVGINATRLFSVLYHRTLNVGRVQTPTLAMLVEREGSLTSLSKEQMEAAGYGVHHNSDDGRYHIMGNGTRAFAVVNAEIREREQRATAKELAVDIDQLCRDHIQGYIHTFPRADYQQEIIAARIMEGETYLFKTQLLNFKQPEETADTIHRLDDFEKDRGIGTYMVYQLKHTDENHLLRFEALDRLYAAGKTVDSSNYELVYAGPFTPGETLETIYRDLNVDHPEDYHGYSLSMSDVIVLREYGKDTAHYCDAIGFTEVPQFLNPQQTQEKENPLRAAEMTIEDDYGMIDGVINNGRRDEPQGKTSIRERLEAAKKECAQQKPPEGKSTGRDTPERSDP